MSTKATSLSSLGYPKQQFLVIESTQLTGQFKRREEPLGTELERRHRGGIHQVASYSLDELANGFL